MIILMNSSKTLDFQKSHISRHTIPEFLKDSEILVRKLRKLSESAFSKLMGVSEKLTKLNVERYANWQTPFTASNAKQALLAFKGDIYAGMETEHYTSRDLEYAQNHLRILSGLHGILRPLDLIQPYRLEMATKLSTVRGINLYSFWGTQISESLKVLLKQEGSGLLVNLCSAEYFKAIKPQLQDTTVITPVFKEFRNGSYRIVAIYAKKARGFMGNYIIRNHLKRVEDIKSFNLEGYQFNKTMSSDFEWIFTREA
jgi:cytoplasmic iron level regulating protein YaaA (DUF328/UPF0246 family)